MLQQGRTLKTSCYIKKKKKSQSQKEQILRDSIYRINLEQSNSQRQNSGCQGQDGAGGGEGSEELMFNWYRISILEDAKVLETSDGDGGTTMWKYLMSLNRTLKNGWNGKVYFTTIKKIVSKTTKVYP